MRNVLDCINAFIPLLSTEYELVLGRKGVSVTLRISFDKKDCFHLMGLQYLVDRPELSRDRGRVFDEIADGTIHVCITKISTFLILCDLAVCLATLYVSFSLVFALMRYLQGKVFLIRFYSPTTLSSSRAEFRLPSRLACA